MDISLYTFYLTKGVYLGFIYPAKIISF